MVAKSGYNRDNGWLKQNDPDKYEAISSHLTQPPEQGEWPDTLMTAKVQDVAWVQEQQLLSMSIKVSLRKYRNESSRYLPTCDMHAFE